MGPGSAELMLDDAQRELLADVRRILDEIVDVAPGTLLEDKPAGVVLHTRLAADDVAEDAVAAAKAALQDRPGVFLKTGNRVLETSVVHASKGEGVAFLRQATGATAVVFAGDDTTDEDALAQPRPGRPRGEGGPGLHPGRVPGGGAGACLRTAGGAAARADEGPQLRELTRAY